MRLEMDLIFLLALLVGVVLCLYIYYRINMVTKREGVPVVLVEDYQVVEEDNSLQVTATCCAYGSSVSPEVYLLARWQSEETIFKSKASRFVTQKTGEFYINLEVPLSKKVIKESNDEELELVMYYNDAFGTCYESPVVKRTIHGKEDTFHRGIRIYPKGSMMYATIQKRLQQK